MSFAQPVKQLPGRERRGVRGWRTRDIHEGAGGGGPGLEPVTRVIKAGETGWPGQDNIGPGPGDGQLRPERKTEDRAVGETTATIRRSIQAGGG